MWRLDTEFFISLGELITPGTAAFPWVNSHSNLIETIGGLENQTAGSYWGGSFSDGVTTDKNFELSYRVGAEQSASSIFYVGFITNQSQLTTSPNVLNFYGYPSSTPFSMNQLNGSTFKPAGTLGDLITIKRVRVPNTTTADITVLINGVQYGTALNLNVTATWFPFFYLGNVNKFYNATLLIL